LEAKRKSKVGGWEGKKVRRAEDGKERSLEEQKTRR
jgi:hypothetical protein